MPCDHQPPAPTVPLDFPASHLHHRQASDEKHRAATGTDWFDLPLVSVVGIAKLSVDNDALCIILHAYQPCLLQ